MVLTKEKRKMRSKEVKKTGEEVLEDSVDPDQVDELFEDLTSTSDN